MVLNGMIVAIVENFHGDFLVVRGSSGDWRLMDYGLWESWGAIARDGIVLEHRLKMVDGVAKFR